MSTLISFVDPMMLNLNGFDIKHHVGLAREMNP